MQSIPLLVFVVMALCVLARAIRFVLGLIRLLVEVLIQLVVVFVALMVLLLFLVHKQVQPV